MPANSPDISAEHQPQANASVLPVAPERSRNYLVFLVLAMALIGFFDNFSTTFRYAMSAYVGPEFKVEFSTIASWMTLVFLGSCLSFIPRVLADVVGRRWVACFTLLALCVLQWAVGFAQTIEQYILLLTLLAIVYKCDIWYLIISEEAPAAQRARYVGVTMGLAVIGSFVLAELLAHWEPDKGGWRSIARITIWGVLGVVPLLFLLRETRHFQEVVRNEKQRLFSATLIAPFSPRTLKPMFVLSLLKSLFVGVFFVTVVLTETQFLKTEHKFSPAIVGRILEGEIIAGIFGSIAAGFLADRIGRRWCFFLFCAQFSVSLACAALLPKGSVGVMVAYVSQGMAGIAIMTLLSVAVMEMLPNDCRATGSAWTDLFVTLTAAGASALIGKLVKGTPENPALMTLSGVILCVALLAPVSALLYALLPETRGKEMEAI